MAERQPSFWQRIRSALAIIRLAGGTKVAPVEPGRENDGINRAWHSLGTDIDRPSIERTDDIADALEAWRKNPLARRIVGIVIGDGITIESKYAPLQRFIDEFWEHGRKRITTRSRMVRRTDAVGRTVPGALHQPHQRHVAHPRHPAARIDDIR